MFELNGVLWRVYLVSPQHPFLIKPNGSTAIGVCDKNAQKILISDNLAERELKLVLCHEIVHAAMFSYNINLSYEDEEMVAVLLSTYGEEIIEITNRIFNNKKKWGVY